MKILITGNSGYIGSHLSQILLKLPNYEIHGLDKNPPQIAPHKHFTYDIIDNFSIDDQYDCVIHLAAQVSVGESVENPILYYLTNTVGTLNVLKNIKTKKFVLASTGAASSLQSPYGISKRAAEDILIQFGKDQLLPFTIFRFYNVIGSDGFNPTNKDGLMWNLINAKHTGIFNLYGTDYNTKDGTALRDYVHVNEICFSIINSLNCSTNRIENLGHGVGTSVKEIINIFKISNNCEFTVNYCNRREGDIETSVLDNPSKFMQKLYSLKDLLKV